MRREGGWTATLEPQGGAPEQVRARAVVNAAGPWVDKVLGRALPDERHENLRLVKGSHLIVPRLWDGPQCYIFQNADGRIVFAIPYEREFTLLGTTDVLFEGDPAHVTISQDEREYICKAVNEYLAHDVSPADAVSSYSGVRPLYDDKSSSNSTVTRDYVFELEGGGDGGPAPILSIFGGKITTFRKLAEHALAKLQRAGVTMAGPWNEAAILPGGAIDPLRVDAYMAKLAAHYPWAGAAMIRRLVRAYGSMVPDILGEAPGPEALGAHFGGDLYEAEVRHLVICEFARSAEDVLWRRSKLGLHLPQDAQDRLADWFAAQPA